MPAAGLHSILLMSKSHGLSWSTGWCRNLIRRKDKNVRSLAERANFCSHHELLQKPRPEPGGLKTVWNFLRNTFVNVPYEHATPSVCAILLPITFDTVVQKSSHKTPEAGQRLLARFRAKSHVTGILGPSGSGRGLLICCHALSRRLPWSLGPPLASTGGPFAF